jgi:hypothetical protein
MFVPFSSPNCPFFSSKRQTTAVHLICYFFVKTLTGGPYLSFSSPPLDPIWPEWMGLVAQERRSSTRGGLRGHSQAADLAASHADLATTLTSWPQIPWRSGCRAACSDKRPTTYCRPGRADAFLDHHLQAASHHSNIADVEHWHVPGRSGAPNPPAICSSASAVKQALRTGRASSALPLHHRLSLRLAKTSPFCLARLKWGQR